MKKDDLRNKRTVTSDGEEKPSSSVPARDARVKGAQDAERIKELRERLYARGSAPTLSTRHMLPQHVIHETVEKPPDNLKQKVKHEQTYGTQQAPDVSHEGKHSTKEASEQNAVLYNEPMGYISRRKSLRKKIALASVLFFMVAVASASLLILSGNNTISGNNISINVSGPISIGGGEELQFQVSVANQNTVSIQSATLIIEYPKGTHSATEINKEISVERKQLDTIGTGELVNIPLKARVFGEENEEKEIKVSIDYRIEGSNATFHKEATPLHFKVSTSPIVMTFDTLKTISSGQEVVLKLTVQSNAPSPLTDILIKVAYPEGFDFTASDPDTVSAEDTWKIATLKPAEKKVITIKGLMTGYETETRRFTATAGVADVGDKNTLASILAKAQTDIEIEKPFLDVGVFINGSNGNSVVINTEEVALVEVRYQNVLDTAIYDGKVLVELSGNALNEFKVESDDGFYDSTTNTITWDSTDVAGLKEILPGRSSSLSFSLDPKKNIGRAPEMNIKVTVQGQRVFENRAPQELVGTALRTIKVESVPVLTASAFYNQGPFVNTGPTPPVAEKITQYTFTIAVKTATNDITGAEVTAVIPQYVSWLDLVTSGNTVTYNATTRIVKWTIGDINANSEKEVSMQVSLLPSLSQVGTTPTILEAQRFKATDRFTGTVVRTDHPALTTSLFNEPDDDLKNGRVRAKE